MIVTTLPSWQTDPDRVQGRVIKGVSAALGQEPQVAPNIIEAILQSKSGKYLMNEATVVANEVGAGKWRGAGAGGWVYIAEYLRRESERLLGRGRPSGPRSTDVRVDIAFDSEREAA